MKVYPGIIKPASAISSDLRAHFRYPEDLFKVQRELLTKYHVDNPVQFFNTEDFWKVPDDPEPDSTGNQPPYYLLAQAPGQTAPTYQLTSALNALSRDNLSAYATVSSDPADYGLIRVLKVPGTQAVLGPGQVQNRFNSDSGVRSAVYPLTTTGSKLVYGNLLTLPVAQGLLYVEPLYVQAQSSAQANTYPILQKVLVSFGNDVAVGDTLSQALETLFGSGAGQQASDQGSSPPATPTATATATGSASPSSPTPTAASPSSAPGPGGTDLAAAVTQISNAIADLKAAYKSGDLAKIGAAQAELESATNAYEKAGGLTATATARPPSPTPTR